MSLRVPLSLLSVALCVLGPAFASGQEKPADSVKPAGPVMQAGVWTDPADATLPAVFAVQGEYVGQIAGGAKLGAQVIALDEIGAVQAVVHPGGLPGDGWNEKEKILLDGKLTDGQVPLVAAEGQRKYMDGSPPKFSATRTFPPEGHKPWKGRIADGILSGTTDDGQSFTLKKTERKSPTLGEKPPEGALVLFDGKDGAKWSGGRVDSAAGVLHTDAQDVKSKDKFKAYSIHLEFLLPFRPKARGQGRGNSGFYQTNGQEVQVLDSFGLDGLDNECGGLYSQKAPRINLCYPPLAWQTYDVDLLPAPTEKDKNAALLTVRHNGVVIHDKVPTKLGGGGFTLQGHGNLLQYRNIWLVDRSPAPPAK
jgi:hypothetical protein